jgi:3-phenylpropionate/trans-cinnamate dioxygenase ferredoxin subunit
MPRIRVCREDELGVGEARRVPGVPAIALVRAPSGWFAVDDLCTHGQASLSQGFIEDDTVECPLHMARFCLRSGAALSAPADRAIGVHAVIVEGGQVYVERRS